MPAKTFYCMHSFPFVLSLIKLNFNVYVNMCMPYYAKIYRFIIIFQFKSFAYKHCCQIGMKLAEIHTEADWNFLASKMMSGSRYCIFIPTISQLYAHIAGYSYILLKFCTVINWFELWTKLYDYRKHLDIKYSTPLSHFVVKSRMVCHKKIPCLRHCIIRVISCCVWKNCRSRFNLAL